MEEKSNMTKVGFNKYSVLEDGRLTSQIWIKKETKLSYVRDVIKIILYLEIIVAIAIFGFLLIFAIHREQEMMRRYEDYEDSDLSTTNETTSNQTSVSPQEIPTTTMMTVEEKPEYHDAEWLQLQDRLDRAIKAGKFELSFLHPQMLEKISETSSDDIISKLLDKMTASSSSSDNFGNYDISQDSADEDYNSSSQFEKKKK